MKELWHFICCLALYIHQLPQNLAGFFLSRSWLNRQYFTTYNGDVVLVYFTRNVFGAGIPLGDYIILDNENYYATNCMTAVSHEHGHQYQSLYLGWLYLPVVGLVSFVRCAFDRLILKRFLSSEKRYKWYYSGYPESWADKLGQVPDRW